MKQTHSLYTPEKRLVCDMQADICFKLTSVLTHRSLSAEVCAGFIYFPVCLLRFSSERSKPILVGASVCMITFSCRKQADLRNSEHCSTGAPAACAGTSMAWGRDSPLGLIICFQAPNFSKMLLLSLCICAFMAIAANSLV